MYRCYWLINTHLFSTDVMKLLSERTLAKGNFLLKELFTLCKDKFSPEANCKLNITHFEPLAHAGISNLSNSKTLLI